MENDKLSIEIALYPDTCCIITVRPEEAARQHWTSISIKEYNGAIRNLSYNKP